MPKNNILSHEMGSSYNRTRKADPYLTNRLFDLMAAKENDLDLQKQDAINYQLFSTGQGIRYTFFINTNAGITWQLVAGENEVLSFQALE
jgi:hypothetical protein